MVELFINNTLCDVPLNFTVRLNRQLLTPKELNTKDAQYSYSIKLPVTDTNNRIFSFASIEETKGKFTRTYSAELIVNGVRVFTGLFRLSHISRKEFQGNLYKPAPKSVNDIFGEMKMNEHAPFLLDFTEFAPSVSMYNNGTYNRAKYGDISPAIFPYVLYGLLPKVPQANGVFSPNDVWDDTVRVGVQDLPPSANVLNVLKHIFQSKGYRLVGSAFNDTRLTRLYMSYKNPSDYEQVWNWARLGKIEVFGNWSNRFNKREAGFVQQLESKVWLTGGRDGNNLHACDILNSDNVNLNVGGDAGHNVSTRIVNEGGGRESVQTQVRVPVSGFYKVQFYSKVSFPSSSWLGTNGGMFYSSGTDTDQLRTSIKLLRDRLRTSIKLLRDRKQGDFGIRDSRIDGVYYRDNLPQREGFDINNSVKYVPYETSPTTTPFFIDPLQNSNFLAGLQWGRRGAIFRSGRTDVNPLFWQGNGIAADAVFQQVQFARPGRSWDSQKDDIFNNIITHNPIGYARIEHGFDANGNPSGNWSRGMSRLFIMRLLNGAVSVESTVERANTRQGSGWARCIVWLERGELLTIADVADVAFIFALSPRASWAVKEVDFDLSLEPYKAEKEWLNIDIAGAINGVHRWDEAPTFRNDEIDLVKFLPSNVRTDEFINNFCKAFNLQLIQTGENEFELNVKQTEKPLPVNPLNLDDFAAVPSAKNTPLGLPEIYRIGFTVNDNEEGYKRTEDNGGGEFKTGATDGGEFEQRSSFSFNWLKPIRRGTETLQLPIISNYEVWETEDYGRDMLRRFTDFPIRFWYHDGTFDIPFRNQTLQAARVRNEIPHVNVLSYHNAPNTILDNFFTLLVDGSSHFTEIEGYLPPAHYEALNGRRIATFNSDVYYIAEIRGYDPTGRNKTRLKLIRKV